ncbi:MAG: molybdopterin biosynthesis protein MoeB [Pirellulaceae bacterium]|nr:molybdopterin biosynthesis protein MoeB [Pirellulaceae bacterium]
MTHPSDDRYARQVQFPAIGAEGQQRLSHSQVAILGCGALGSVAAEILARAGVGHLKLIDRDVVEWTNLQRQALYDEHDANESRPKSQASCERLAAINSSIQLEPIVADLVADNIRAILQGVDLVVDAADNFSLRFLLNDWSLSTVTPWVHGGCVGATGQVRLFTGRGKPCFRCLVPDPPAATSVETCDTAGVIGSATHLIASIQAGEAIKWLSGNQNAVRQSMLSIDLWKNRIRELNVEDFITGDCPACDRHTWEFLAGDRGQSADGILCGRNAVQISQLTAETIDLDKIAARWEDVGRVQANPFFVRLFPDDQRSVTLFRDGRVIVTGTTDISEARGLYARFVGG